MNFNYLLKYLGYEKNKVLDFLLDYFDKKKCILDLLERFLINENPSLRFYENEEDGITFFDEDNVGSVCYSWTDDNWLKFSGDESLIDDDSYQLYKKIDIILNKFYEEICLKYLLKE